MNTMCRDGWDHGCGISGVRVGGGGGVTGGHSPATSVSDPRSALIVSCAFRSSNSKTETKFKTYQTNSWLLNPMCGFYKM